MENFFQNIPKFTRFYLVAITSVSILVSFGILDPYLCLFDPQLTFRKFQLWRLFVSPFFLGKLDLNMIFQIFSCYNFFRKLEEQHYQNRLSTLVFVFLSISFFSLLFSGLLGSLSVGSSCYFAMIFIFSKVFSDEMVRFIVIPMNIQYYLFANATLNLITGASIVPVLIGISAGHIVFYLYYILPVLLKRPLFKTPNFLVRLLDGRGAGAPRNRGRRLRD